MLTLADGSVYTGEFVQGEREGRGTLTEPDGTRFSGLWKAGKPVHGILTTKEGVRFEQRYKPDGDVENELITTEEEGKVPGEIDVAASATEQIITGESDDIPKTVSDLRHENLVLRAEVEQLRKRLRDSDLHVKQLELTIETMHAQLVRANEMQLQQAAELAHAGSTTSALRRSMMSP